MEAPDGGDQQMFFGDFPGPQYEAFAQEGLQGYGGTGEDHGTMPVWPGMGGLAVGGNTGAFMQDGSCGYMHDGGAFGDSGAFGHAPTFMDGKGEGGCERPMVTDPTVGRVQDYAGNVSGCQTSAEEHVQDNDGFKLFIAGLPYDCREEELRTVFGTYGEVNKVHLMAPHPQTGNVAAFIFYARAESAEDAIKLLDNAYKIREDAIAPIRVRWAIDKGKLAKTGGGNSWGWKGGSGGNADWSAEPGKVKDVDGYKLFIGGLPSDCMDEELNMIFSSFGEVTKIHRMTPHAETGRVAAFVFYQSSESADEAIKQLNNVYRLREDSKDPIQVRWAQEKSKANVDSGKGGWDSGWSSSGGGKNSGGAPFWEVWLG